MTQSSTFFNNDHGLDNVPIPRLWLIEESHHNDNLTQVRIQCLTKSHKHPVLLLITIAEYSVVYESIPGKKQPPPITSYQNMTKCKHLY